LLLLQKRLHMNGRLVVITLASLLGCVDTSEIWSECVLLYLASKFRISVVFYTNVDRFGLAGPQITFLFVFKVEWQINALLLEVARVDVWDQGRVDFLGVNNVPVDVLEPLRLLNLFNSLASFIGLLCEHFSQQLSNFRRKIRLVEFRFFRQNFSKHFLMVFVIERRQSGQHLIKQHA